MLSMNVDFAQGFDKRTLRMFNLKFLCLSFAWGISFTICLAYKQHRPLRQYPSQINAVANLTQIAIRESKVC